jgi:nitrogen fixation/metabolism regulation signal transduction histidine kinase
MTDQSAAPGTEAEHPPASRHKRRTRFEVRFLFVALLSGVPASLVSILLLWSGKHMSLERWLLTGVVAVFWIGNALYLRSYLVYPLHTLSNLIAALREGDYSLRARSARSDDSMGEVLLEVNALAETLRGRRLGAMEAAGLLRKVMEEIDVAVFTFDTDRCLRLTNRAGERLLGQPGERILGETAAKLGLADCMNGDPSRTLTISFPGGGGRWAMRRSTFREGGMPHELLVLTDLNRPLREEEREAWQRLIRVLGHELNNSLAPIKSMAGTLESILERTPRPDDWEEDLRRGLSVIETRAAALSRFTEAYSRLARLPRPNLKPIDLGLLMRRIVNLESRAPIAVVPGPETTLRADPDQLEQLIINLLRNAADAALETQGGVTVGWAHHDKELEISIKDEGPGVANTSNLFTPFFTTKPAGSGIGLVLGRQIAEAHGGSLVLVNRTDRSGCEARLRLPLEA